ncbi:hypothetical protein LOTGIDRAFT_165911 [Lottia gigantea]|uniref:Multidrug and toxin extrusion protein n=1 Tax=Lottia gigantea TaxID=225164 RepID=V3ZAZ4_LOTGI|nr:hypothetical protein LOTGIDRAFT_165911 [Lottia gigantea]ESO88168.1 hypothetical protein LOTGIDRAFT_165911 [Lottia gigantea]
MEGVLGEFVEISKLMYLTIPTQLLICMPFVISNFLAGHYSTQDFDIVGMSLSVIYSVALSPIFGLSSAAETLLSQTNGSEHRNSLGIVIQRCSWLGFNLCFLVSSVLVHAGFLLKLFRQDAALTHKCQEFILVALPCLFLCSMLSIQIKYLQCQKIVKCIVPIGIIANVLHVGYGILFTFVMGLGAKGICVALSATFLSWNMILFVYIKYSGSHQSTWTGFSMQSLDNWNEHLSIAAPNAFMSGLETSCFEIYTLLVGLIGAVELSAYLILNNIFSLLFNVAGGALTAGTIQIGNYLGSGNHEQAKIAAIATVYVSVGLPLVYVSILLTMHKVIPSIFTKDKLVISMAKPFIVVVSVVQFFDGIAIISSGTIRACGKQLFLAVIDIVVFGVIGIPLSIFLMFWTPLKVYGALISLTIVLIVVCSCIFLRTYFINWQQEATNAIRKTEIDSVTQLTADDQDEMHPILPLNSSRSYVLIIVKIFLCPLIFITSLLTSIMI